MLHLKRDDIASAAVSEHRTTTITMQITRPTEERLGFRS